MPIAPPSFQPGSPISVVLFGVIIAGVIAALLWAIHHAFRANAAQARVQTSRAAVGIAVWLATLGALVASGAMPRLPLSGLPFFFGGIILVSGWLGLSPLGGHLAANVPLAALVGFQAFRLPLELILHSWVESGTIPETMTWSGKNWDIISGITALVAVPFAQKHRAVAWAANAIGLGLLLNVMRVALLSAPVPFGWDVKPPLLVAFHLPYALIGPVCVGGALAGHLVLTRALLRRAPLT